MVEETLQEVKKEQEATLDLLRTLRANFESRHNRLRTLTHFYETTYEKIEEKRS